MFNRGIFCNLFEILCVFYIYTYFQSDWPHFKYFLAICSYWPPYRTVQIQSLLTFPSLTLTIACLKQAFCYSQKTFLSTHKPTIHFLVFTLLLSLFLIAWKALLFSLMSRFHLFLSILFRLQLFGEILLKWSQTTVVSSCPPFYS